MHNGLPKKSDAEIANEIRALPDDQVIAMAAFYTSFCLAFESTFLVLRPEQSLANAACVGGVQ